MDGSTGSEDSLVAMDSPTRFRVFMSLNLVGVLLFVALRKYIYYRIDGLSPAGGSWQDGVVVLVSIFAVNPLCLILAQIVNWFFRWKIKKDSAEPIVVKRRLKWLWAMSFLWVLVAGLEMVVALVIIIGPGFAPRSR